MSINYRGETFAGYNKPKRARTKTKKFAVLAKSGSKVKLIRYGDANMTIKKSEQVPTDQEQFMLLEHMASQIEELENQMQAMRNNTVNLNRAMEDIKNIELNIESMKDKIRNNGNHQ